MSPEDRHEGRQSGDAAIRVTVVVSCFFLVYGVVLPYLAQWLEDERGLDGAAIGAVLSIAQIARLATGPAIALWAERAKDRGAALRWLALAALVAHVFFFFVAKDFWALLLSAFVALTTTQAAAPFVEAAVMRATQKGPVPYGVARGLGSFCFIIANVAGGLLIARFGAGAVALWVMTTLSLYAASVWFGLKPDPAQVHHADAPPASHAIKQLFRQKRFWLLVGATGLIQSSHAYYYGFSNLTWIGQGISPTDVGLLWGAAVAAEVGFLFALPFLEKRISAEGLIAIGGAGALTRWVLLGFAPTGLVLWPLQLLHAASFAATHVGAMRLILRDAPERAYSFAQTIHSGVAMGALMGLATLAAGALYDGIGVHAYWVMAAMAGGGMILGFVLSATAPERPAAFNR